MFVWSGQTTLYTDKKCDIEFEKFNQSIKSIGNNLITDPFMMNFVREQIENEKSRLKMKPIRADSGLLTRNIPVTVFENNSGPKNGIIHCAASAVDGEPRIVEKLSFVTVEPIRKY